MGISIRPEFLNKGHGIRAIEKAKLSIQEKFIEKGLFSILATCAPENHASRRLIEYFGGKLEKELENPYGEGATLLYRVE